LQIQLANKLIWAEGLLVSGQFLDKFISEHSVYGWHCAACRQNLFKDRWKKMCTNSNVLLYILSRYAGVPSRIMAVASQYGIHSLQQTVGTVKFAVWKSFTESVHV